MTEAWKKWKSIAKKVGNVQANILLTIVYIILIIPMAFVKKMFRVKKTELTSFWIKKNKIKQDLAWAKRQ